MKLLRRILFVFLATFAAAFLASIGTAHAGAPQPDISAQGEYTYTVFIPLIVENKDNPLSDVIITTTLPSACTNSSRGALFRALVNATQTIASWPYSWAAAQCNVCSNNIAYARGYDLGRGLAHIPGILGKIFLLILTMFMQVGDIFASMLGFSSSQATAYDISCTAEMEGFCWGLAAIAAVDGMIGGWITVIVILVVAFLSFYLWVWISGQVRNMLQPGSDSGGDGD